MKTSSVAEAGALVLLATLPSGVGPVEVASPATGADARDSSGEGHECGGEPCDAVLRGLRAFFDRKLDGLAANGRACADCHLATDAFQPIALSVPTPGPAGTLPAGTIVRRTSSDPGRALVTGFVGGAAPLDDWDKFDVPGLRGISRTAPYFHNNSAASLDAMVDRYIELFKRVEANFVPGNVVPPIATTDGVHCDRRPAPEERAALLAYLRKL